MQVERRGSLPFLQFPEDLAQGFMMDQVGAGESREIQRNNSGAYLALVLERALAEAQQGPESPRFAMSPRASNRAVIGGGYTDADVAFAALSHKLSQLSSADDRAKRRLDHFAGSQLGPESPRGKRIKSSESDVFSCKAD